MYEDMDKRAADLSLMVAGFLVARDDFARTLISISAGVIALTVAFVKPVSGPQRVAFWNYLLFTSWLCFLSASGFCLTSLWLSKDLRLLRFRFFQQRHDVNSALSKIDPTVRDSQRAMDEIVERIFKPFYRAERWSNRCLNSGIVFFVLGLVFLLITGWRQF